MRPQGMARRDARVVEFPRQHHPQPLHHPARGLVDGRRPGQQFRQAQLAEGEVDAKPRGLGGMALAFWMMMLGAKKEGIATLDLGRCESDNNGLIRYKERLGSLMTSITYWRSPLRHTPLSGTDVWTKLAKQICAWSPDCVRIAAGNKLYRHFG